jgi:hypothetical protein
MGSRYATAPDSETDNALAPDYTRQELDDHDRAERFARRLQTYIVYVDGNETTMIYSSGHNAAERKAQRLFPGRHVCVAYTEI